jgi:SagB-type dehydrogenase family enzyme
LSGRVRIRTSPNLMIYFQDGRLVLENYITRQTFHGSPDTVLLLNYFCKWSTVAQASNALRQYSRDSIIDSILDLLHHELLITKDSDEDRLEQKFSKKWLWPVPARYYHFATKLDEPFSTPDEIRTYYERHLKGKPQPPVYKEYPGSNKIRLLSGAGPEAPLFETMRQRRTTREFSGEPISLSELSRIVFYTWGRLSTYKTKEFGQLLHKASPSAGARHPIEAYAVVNNVKGVAPGIYHYSVKDHSLELLQSGDFRDKCVKFAAGQEWTRDASVLFLMTTAVSRTAWKYRVPRVYRAFLLDAGHLSQSFLLVSTALGLGAFCIGIISDLTIEKELGIDGVNEAVLFAVGVGRPVAKTRT